jgi:glyoxylase-like metal-dependent hydrolase (beta-lactamase superfamily II)
MKLYTINTGYFKLDGGAMFGVVPKTIWEKLNPADDLNLCNWALRCLLIEEGDRLILVDNGIGDKQDAKFFSHYYLHGSETLESSLSAHGFSKSDITDVFLTHLHFDHCGGSIDRKDGKLLPAFPNATYWSNERHWKCAVEPNDREKASFLKENILPMQESGRLKMIPIPEEPQTNLADFTAGVKVRFVSGHTEAMMLPQISYKGQTVVFMADLLPSLSHIPLPYVMAYDMHPLTTMQEKKSFLSQAVRDDFILFFEHDPLTECCRVKKTEKGIRSSEKFDLREV